MINGKRIKYLIQYEDKINRFKKENVDIHYTDFSVDLNFLKDIFYCTRGGYVFAKAEKLNKTYGNVLDWLYNVSKKPVNFSSHFSKRSDAEKVVSNFLSDKNKLDYVTMVEINEYKKCDISYIPVAQYFDSFNNKTMILVLMLKNNKFSTLEHINLNAFKKADLVTEEEINHLNKIVAILINFWFNLK